MTLVLSDRLRTIADLLPANSSFIDVGSDHAYVPIYCVKKGKSPIAIAGELNRLPYEQSLANVADHGLSELISVRHGDGLSVTTPGEVDAAVIAGMGGGTIVGILQAQPSVVDSFKYMVLQPQNDEAQLRHFLCRNQWTFVEELVVEENDLLYQIMLVTPGTCEPLDQLQAMFGPVNLFRQDAKVRVLLKRHLAKLQYVKMQLQNATTNEAKAKLRRVHTVIREIEEELAKWHK